MGFQSKESDRNSSPGQESHNPNFQSSWKPYSFIDPPKPAYWTTPVPRSVKYAAGGNLTIQEVLASIHDKRDLKNTIVLLKDPDDPKRPSFLITTLKSRFFPRGIWYAYLYTNRYPDPLDYHLIGSLPIAIETNLIPPWQTWRFLSRHLSHPIDTANPRRLREHEGISILTDFQTILPLCREAGEHNRLGLSERETKATRGFTPTVETLHSQELPLPSPEGGKLTGMPQSWLLWEQRKLCAVANSQVSVSSPSIMGRHRGTSTANSDLVATQDA